MKKITAIICTLSMLVALTACDRTAPESNTSEISSNESLSENNTPESSAAESLDAEKPSLPEDINQILKPVNEFADLYFELFPINEIVGDLADKSQSVSEETSYGVLTYYKVVNGDVQTEEQFNEKLDSLLTENRKKAFLEDPQKKFMFSKGSLYVKSQGAGGYGTGMDCLYLDSVEYSDESTVTVTVTSFGDKDNWGTSEDIADTYTVTLVKTEDGFRIDKYDHGILLDFWYYNELAYGDTTIDLGKL